MIKTLLILSTITCYLVLPTDSFSQGSWTAKANYAGLPVINAAYFTIGNKVYAGIGGTGTSSNLVYMQDFWQWDPCTNVWTRMADFPGAGRLGASSFAIGNKGYIALGISNMLNFDTPGPNAVYYKDLWEYNPDSNKWTR